MYDFKDETNYLKLHLMSLIVISNFKSQTYINAKHKVCEVDFPKHTLNIYYHIYNIFIYINNVLY